MSPDRDPPADLPIVDRDGVDPGVDLEDGPAVAGLLLAAGTSSRFGSENKLLEDVDGEPIVRHAARTLVDSRIDPIVVVLGHEARRVRDALEGLPLEFVVNEAYERGQASSVRTGIRTIRGRTAADAVVVALGDMPFVDPRTVDALVAAYAAGTGDALAAAYEGERGNPVLFDARFFEQLTGVEGDIGGRRILLEDDSSALVAVDDPGVRRDVDVPDDLPR
ncbi:nucleotidyltransferase family protein [Natronobeatus ordinarius]|uniref:nucleotidyltransferase family protein n=1 Tax=Natronobeatus ordinarius TaxID=2963433 RepID=UPI0020CF0D77|nr:nucleotidyltransferase family protein [Natronobeatus ordinarius]